MQQRKALTISGTNSVMRSTTTEMDRLADRLSQDMTGWS